MLVPSFMTHAVVVDDPISSPQPDNSPPALFNDDEEINPLPATKPPTALPLVRQSESEIPQFG